MIKLERGGKPDYLTDAKIQHLKNRYATTKTSVWSRKSITKPLMNTCFGKCAYCEKLVNGNGSYMEVDHYRYKDLHEDLIVEWSNLIPSCKQCNTKKGKHDVDINPIVNPYDDNPNEHFIYHCLRIIGITPKGEMSVELFGYNLRDVDARKSRLIIHEKIDEKLSDGLDLYRDYQLSGDPKKLLKSRNSLSGILSACQINSEYSAITSTLLLLNPQFIDLMNKIKNEGVWDDVMKNYFDMALSSSFPVKRDEYSLVKSL
ncbi:hypothetical protein C5Y41_03965 [Rahnella variigena]|uniref:HNH endonuclease n=1 Tax=Rahnella variigena TaxID=574964 RepID=UPI00101BE814|nr:HNH endonuclease [Rahnella variigena]RYJ16449.1 hypothetical protein C5Y41_03965 [Rahnella variigena]